MLRKISKRQRFIISVFLLSLSLVVVQIINFPWRYLAIAGLTVLTYLLAAWSLNEGLTKIGWLTILTLPAFFTASVGLFYFLIPTSWLARLPVIIFFGVGIYILLLSGNIFSVAAIRTIQLLRSAQAVGFLLTLGTAFFFYGTIFSFRLDFWLNFLLILLISFPLILQGLWCINLEEKISSQVLTYSLVLSLVQGETALALSFWPLSVVVRSLALATSLYITLGLTQHRLNEKLLVRTINEYLSIGIAVLGVIFLTTHWGG